MVAPAATAGIQNGNKCPHGLPPGACPICSGMGGGGIPKDRNKPRVPGEMSYNECMAAWIKIQAAKEAKIQAEIDKVQAAQALSAKNNAILAAEKLAQNLEKYLQKLDQANSALAVVAKVVINVLVKPILNIVTTVLRAINNIQAFFSNITQFISSVTEKLASVYGEIKNFINAKITEPIKKGIKTILAFFTQGESEENEEAQKIKTRELKKVLKGLFRIKSKQEEDEDDKDK